MLRNNQASGSKKNWKAFRDMLCLKRVGKAWTSTFLIPASDMPINTNKTTNRMMIWRGSSRYPSDPRVNELDGDATRQLWYMSDRQRNDQLLPLDIDPDVEDDNNPQTKAGKIINNNCHWCHCSPITYPITMKDQMNTLKNITKNQNQKKMKITRVKI